MTLMNTSIHTSMGLQCIYHNLGLYNDTENPNPWTAQNKILTTHSGRSKVHLNNLLQKLKDPDIG